MATTGNGSFENPKHGIKATKATHINIANMAQELAADGVHLHQRQKRVTPEWMQECYTNTGGHIKRAAADRSNLPRAVTRAAPGSNYAPHLAVRMKHRATEREKHESTQTG